MSAFKQRLARIGASAGVLAVTTAAILGVGGVSASSAFACSTKSTIEGQGSTLQNVAQTNWISGFGAVCPETPTVKYTGTGSGAALTAFGYNGGAIDHTYSYVGTDDAPSAAQITAAQGSTGQKALVIPVSETAIAIIYNPPAECTLSFGETKGITSAQLNGAFGGEAVKTWNGFTNASPTGAGCANQFTRVVREDGSGTTFQLKNYFAVDGGPAMPCKLTGIEEPAETEVAETTAWANMKSTKATKVGVPNTTWPQKTTCPGAPETLTSVAVAKGGGGLVKYVAEHPGTIGYASLPDVKSANNVEGKAKIAWIQNSTKPVTFASPEGEVEQSNCGERQYTVPKPGREGETGESVNWSQVFGAKPTVGGKLYPLCTLTYDLSWKGYEKAGYGASSEEKAKGVKEYLTYVLGTGQGVKKWYQPLPTGGGLPEFNVLAAGKLAAGLISK